MANIKSITRFRDFYFAFISGLLTSWITKVIERLSPHQHMVHTITAGNGKEFAEHKLISSVLRLDFYFARPYHSWKRGANENTNGLTHLYFPKKHSSKQHLL